MNQPSDKKQVEQKLHGQQTNISNLTIDNSEQTARLQESPSSSKQKWSLKTKAIVWALAVSMLPVLAVGTATYYLNSELISKQISQARLVDATGRAETEALQRQQSLLLVGTGVTAVLVGAIAVILANRAIRPVLNAARISTTMVNKLRGVNAGTGANIALHDELVVLETNISLIKEKLPDLLWKQEVEAEYFHMLMNITRRIQKSLNEEDVLKTTVEEVRTALKTDRAVIFRFNSNWDGTFVEESVASGLPKMLWATISEPHFQREDIERYRQGCVRTIDDIYQAKLSDSDIGMLERFGVKSTLIAPIHDNNKLFGLLIAHQCSRPRVWQQSETDLLLQIATQVRFALDYARLLERVDTKADQAQVFIDITRRIRKSLNEENVLKTTVEEIRKELSADRVIVYGFDANWYGTVIAESVVPGFPKALRAKIHDPCFAEGYVELYQTGRVKATNNIYEAGLTDCYLSQLEPFAVKANLVASILKDDQLFGLLIAHQCSGPRDWRQSEINLFAQIATQVGFALDHARLLQRIDAEGVRTRLRVDITRRIRESLHEDDVLKTTVEEVRKAFSADRALVNGFDTNWDGTLIAESVLPGFPKALGIEIKDRCFPEGCVEMYKDGRVKATNNIYEAGLPDCYLSQLEPFAVKANLVAPITKDNQLFGLLILHQCSGPRDWQQSEINLFAQIATQVGFALDHARLLKQVEQAYQLAETTSHKQRQQQQEIQRQVSQLLRSSQTVVQTFSTEVGFKQMKLVTSTHNQIQMLADAASRMVTCAQQAKLQQQQLSQTLQDEHKSLNRIFDSIAAIQQTVAEVFFKVERLDKPSEKLYQILSLMSNVVSQVKLQAMQTALEASQSGEAGQKFASIAEKLISLVQQLDLNIAQIKPLVAEIQTQTNEVIAAMKFGAEETINETELVKETQQKLKQIVTISAQMKILVTQLAQNASIQAQTSTSATQSILLIASIASQTSEQALAVADSLANLAAFAQKLKQANG